MSEAFFKTYPGADELDIHSAIMDQILQARKSIRIKTLKTSNKHKGNFSLCEMRSDCSPYRFPICETYLLYPRGKGGAAGKCKKHTATIIEELEHAGDNRFAVMVLSNCIDVVDCNQNVLEEVGFTPWPKEKYRSYRKFSNVAKKLIEESILYFEAPCCRLLHHLRKQQLGGLLETY